MIKGVDLITRERMRQFQKLGYTAEHDDTNHASSELLAAAICYANVAFDQESDPDVDICEPPAEWPWAEEEWGPSTDSIRNLTKAGALIAAEIDRLERLRK